MTTCRVLYLSDSPGRTRICWEYSPTGYPPGNPSGELILILSRFVSLSLFVNSIGYLKSAMPQYFVWLKTLLQIVLAHMHWVVKICQLTLELPRDALGHIWVRFPMPASHATDTETSWVQTITLFETVLQTISFTWQHSWTHRKIPLFVQNIVRHLLAIRRHPPFSARPCPPHTHPCWCHRVQPK